MSTFLRFVTIALISALFFQCSDLFDDSKGSGSDADETYFYQQIAAGFVSCIASMYNQNLAGKPTGNQNITADGPLGGTVTITGTTSVDNTHNITTVDLVYDTDAVRCTSVFGDPGSQWTISLEMSGTVTHKGSFSYTYADETFNGETLHLKVSSAYNGKTSRTLDETGAIVLHRQDDHISGTIFSVSVAL